MKHGTIYLNKNRYWWKVKLPGSNKLEQIPLKPQGAKFATEELAVAREVAKSIWKQAQTKGRRTDGRTIPIQDTLEAKPGLISRLNAFFIAYKTRLCTLCHRCLGGSLPSWR